MITALQSQKIKAANQLVESRETLWTASNNMYFNGDESQDLRSMVTRLDEMLTKLVPNDKPDY